MVGCGWLSKDCEFLRLDELCAHLHVAVRTVSTHGDGEPVTQWQARDRVHRVGQLWLTTDGPLLSICKVQYTPPHNSIHLADRTESTEKNWKERKHIASFSRRVQHVELDPLARNDVLRVWVVHDVAQSRRERIDLRLQVGRPLLLLSGPARPVSVVPRS